MDLSALFLACTETIILLSEQSPQLVETLFQTHSSRMNKLIQFFHKFPKVLEKPKEFAIDPDNELYLNVFQSNIQVSKDRNELNEVTAKLQGTIKKLYELQEPFFQRDRLVDIS